MMNDFFQGQGEKSGSVDCLGQTFPNDAARRDHFLAILREKLKDPAFRKIEGFPIGTDEDILALSDPPYYTACPNPFIEDFIKHYGTPYDSGVPYSKEPYVADVSEGKNDPIYNAHSYHTKVPHKAIMRYILHYTQPGDLVFDGFCGTGMTGVAAQLCGDRAVVESLGYRVEADGTISEQDQINGRAIWRAFSKIGARRAILNDLSPAATFISHSYSRFRTAATLAAATKPILDSAEKKLGWMYQTLHRPTESALRGAIALIESADAPDLSSAAVVGRINYIVWSDVFTCPECAGDIVFWEAAVDKALGKIRDVFDCPHCSASLGKRSLEPKTFVIHEESSGENIVQRVQVPAYINYSVGGKRFVKEADIVDKQLAETIANSSIGDWFPNQELPKGDKTGEPIRLGITRIHHFYTERILSILSFFRSFGVAYWAPFSALTPRATRMHRIAASRIGGDKKGEGGATVGVIIPLSSEIFGEDASVTG